MHRPRLAARAAPLLVTTLFSVLLAGCTSPDTEPSAAASPYVDQVHGPVRGLSAAEVADLRSGAGMGLARPAELNGYPGPLHVLELAEPLGLTMDQWADVQALREAVVRDAVAAGAAVLEAHARLEARFRSGDIDAAALAAEVAALDAAYADLRYVHLKAHLDTLPLLSVEQRAAYDAMRGYAPDEDGGDAAASPDHDGDHAAGGHPGHGT